jgi:hypothetical protein
MHFKPSNQTPKQQLPYEDRTFRGAGQILSSAGLRAAECISGAFPKLRPERQRKATAALSAELKMSESLEPKAHRKGLGFLLLLGPSQK